jgi:hypothetical protein
VAFVETDGEAGTFLLFGCHCGINGVVVVVVCREGVRDRKVRGVEFLLRISGGSRGLVQDFSELLSWRHRGGISVIDSSWKSYLLFVEKYGITAATKISLTGLKT